MRPDRVGWWVVGAGAAAVLVALVLSPVFAQQGVIRYVNRTDATCQGRSPCYTTIQAAVNGAQAGDTVRIQAGTYPEQVSIQGKNNVATATEADRIIIEADPAAPLGTVGITGAVAQCTNGYAVRFQQSKFVTLRGLTLTAAGGQAISLLGGNNQNQAIHLERNRLFGNGSAECNGGITIARGNPDTLIVNNIVYANGRNGITFLDADGGPHYLIQNTIHGNQWDGVSVARSHVVYLANNSITGNGTAAGSTGGRFGVSREASTSPQPAGVHLLNNLICGNRLGEIDGPALDATDAGNLTPTGREGPGVSASPGCDLPATVYADLDGPDNALNTADDDFSLKAGSPAIDRGMDPRTLGLNALFNSLFEADFATLGARPRDGHGDGTAAFDMGAREFVPGGGPTVTGLSPDPAVHGQTIALTVTGTNLAGSSVLTFLKKGAPDPALAASGLQANAEGTQLQATVTLAPSAALGPRIVTVTTPAGTSSATATTANTFTVLGQLTLVPDFLSLVEGQSGGLTAQLSAPAPAGGLTMNLASAATGIASVPATLTVAGGTTNASTAVTAAGPGTTNIIAAAAGFAGGLSAVTVVRDTTPPAVTITSPGGGLMTKQSTVTVQGTATDAASGVASVTVNGVAATLGAGTFTAANVPLSAEGANTLIATATDRAGNTATASVTTVRDTTPPAVAITSPATGALTNQTSLTVMGTVTDVNGVAAVTVNGVAAVVSGSGFQAAGVALQAEGGNTLVAMVTDAAGNTATASVTVTRSTAVPTLTITSPADGATLSAASVQVRGTATAAGTEVGVSVNGFAAQVNGGQWAIEVPLVNGSNVIVVTATAPLGASSTVSMTVNIPQALPAPLVLTAAPDSGVAPRTVTFVAINQTGRKLVQFEFDPTGSGTFGSPTPTFEGVTSTYTAPGLVFPILRAIDDQGTIYTARTIVNVDDPLVVTARFQGRWNSLKGRLQAGDNAGALTHLAPSLQPRFQAIFQQLGSDLPTIAAGLGDVQVLEQAGDLAETVIVQQKNGVPFLYFIYFRRDSLGRWLIEEM